ncbi:conserved hypothetical protein [Candida albicans WO-1]|uniref:Uncharacterized protein n=1 Tax=Candida albicans (strain WO-1) TaxID=294748 RepID=C4YHQ8_CANAW|nr:conserved hypothetical protein [Candida albicans WO-1]
MVLIISLPIAFASWNIGWKKFWVSSNSRLYNSKFPKSMILDQVCAAIVKFKSSCSNEVSLTATSILSSKYPGVQNTYSVTPKKILNNGVEQIIWSYGTIPKLYQLSTIANNDKWEFGCFPSGGVLLKENFCKILSSNNKS